MAKIKRTKNATRNIVFGVILRLYQIFVTFLMRTAIIYRMGVQYLGLNSLFTSVLQVLNLAELGVGSAMVYSMYKPIAEDDETTICALMKLYKTYYRVIGFVIVIVGCILTPFIPYLIKSDVPAGINIYVLYLLNLGAAVLSYWLFAYKNSILQAHQRTDVVSKVTLITSTVQYGLQIAVLWLFHNYYLFVIVALATQALTNIVTAVCVNKLYPQFKPKGKLPKNEVKAINKRVRDLFTAKLGGVVVNSADTIVVSAFLGLTVLAVYQNYYMILTSVIGFVSVVFSACTAGIGNSLIVETKEKNFNDLNKFTFLISWIAGICSCCFLGVYQPFMKLWVGDDLLLPFSAVIYLVAYYYIYEINQLLNLYKDAGGIWHEDRFRPLVTAIANVSMNLIMVQFWGIYGVLLSTVLSMMFVGMPWLFHNLFTTLFDRSQLRPYLNHLFKYTITAVVSCVIVLLICNFINFGLITTILLRLVVCVTIPFVIYIVLFWRSSEFKQSMLLLDNMTKGKLKLRKIFRIES
ncbi:polysaccharide biosynthesis C-terminal domain-containing protein [Candidatus Allofournierella merdipullorum]|uniref:polysaccharide biosynthesis C-terminal domain-containing protein n=1 Tax=Candidatus Allofournierella merdipullorum TaxID=2838595 RepID=UPI002A8A2C62|nr:oligosaccharide flippase family protein [Candidatus Fournierella merdipullorum]